MELIQTNPQIFNDATQQRRMSDASMQSAVSGLAENIPLTTINACEFKLLVANSFILPKSLLFRIFNLLSCRTPEIP